MLPFPSNWAGVDNNNKMSPKALFLICRWWARGGGEWRCGMEGQQEAAMMKNPSYCGRHHQRNQPEMQKKSKKEKKMCVNVYVSILVA
jgi:hypothetical protein